MNRLTRSLLVSVAALSCGLVIPAGSLPAQEAKALHSAIKPVPRDPNWVKRHEAFVAIAKRGGVDLLFLGDSITDGWGGEGHPKNAKGTAIFEKEFVPLKAANFGIGGDRTQHVLWRLQNGELNGIQPKVAMLMIGTNNSNGKDNTAAEIADGITAIVNEIHHHSPTTKVLMLAVFPRSSKRKSAEENQAQMAKINEVNRVISKLDDGGKTVRYLDINKKFLDANGVLPESVMPDLLHPNAKGYRIWADAVKGPIQEMLGKKL